MLKSTPIVALTSLMGGFLTGVGEARVVESACIKSTPLFGQKENLPYGRMDGDMNDIAEMSLLSLAYSRPSNLLICADEKKVHGMRFTLKMHISEETKPSKTPPKNKQLDNDTCTYWDMDRGVTQSMVEKHIRRYCPRVWPKR